MDKKGCVSNDANIVKEIYRDSGNDRSSSQGWPQSSAEANDLIANFFSEAEFITRL